MSFFASHRRAWAWTLVGALLCLPLLAPAASERPPPLPLRLFTPFAELAAEVQWVRFAMARQRGEEVRALQLAESALTLDPGNSAGWECLAAHLALFQASREREPDLARRRAWFEAGLHVLERGLECARDAGALHLQRGILLLTKAEVDPELAQGGAAEFFGRAAEAFALAAEAGVGGARELELYALERSAGRE